jgi:hypothetical protein
MPDDSAQRIQELQSRIGGLRIALEACLERLAALHGNQAQSELEALRDELVRRMKSSSTPPERDLDHARLVGPMIEVVETVFNATLAELNKGGRRR